VEILLALRDALRTASFCEELAFLRPDLSGLRSVPMHFLYNIMKK
jgi:hypothetical protein